MRLAQLVCFLVALVAGTAFTVDATTRLAGVSKAEQAADLVVATQELRASFGRADGAAVNAFLAGGIEEPAQRAGYQAATDDAATALIRAGRAADEDAAVTLVQELQRQLPVYAGLIETARADNRQELPLGAAYLRTASDLVRTDIDGDLTDLRAQGDEAYRSDVDGVLGGTGIISGALAAAAVLALLAAQVWMFLRTNRVLNTGMLAATVILGVGLASFGLMGQEAAVDALDATHAYDRLSALSQLQADAYGQQSQSTFALVDRGGRDGFNAEAATSAQNVDARLEATGRTADTASDVSADLTSTWDAYLALSDQVTGLDQDGDYVSARDLAFQKPALFDAFDTTITAEAGRQSGDLSSGLDSSRGPLSAIQFGGIPLGVIVGAVAGWGIQRRINDYR